MPHTVQIGVAFAKAEVCVEQGAPAQIQATISTTYCTNLCGICKGYSMCDTISVAWAEPLHNLWPTSYPVHKRAALATSCFTQVAWLACGASAQIEATSLRQAVLHTHQL